MILSEEMNMPHYVVLSTCILSYTNISRHFYQSLLYHT